MNDPGAKTKTKTKPSYESKGGFKTRTRIALKNSS